MLQSIGNSVVLYIGCLVSAVRQDQGIRVAHCDAVPANCSIEDRSCCRRMHRCSFDRNPKAVCQKPDSGCFAEIFLSQFPGLVFMYEHRKCSSANLRKVSISESADGKARNLSNVKWLYCFGRVESQIFYYSFCFQLLNSFRNST